MKKHTDQAQVKADQVRATTTGICQYSAAHTMQGITATTIIALPYGNVPACYKCADFYDRTHA